MRVTTIHDKAPFPPLSVVEDPRGGLGVRIGWREVDTTIWLSQAEERALLDLLRDRTAVLA
jgi:hypothetical protein